MRKAPFGILIFFLISVKSTDRTRVCNKSAGQPTDLIVNCFVRLGETACLICPVATSENGLAWHAGVDDRKLFRDENNIASLSTSIGANECEGNQYSLKISNIFEESMDGEFRCKQRQTTLAEFWVQVQGIASEPQLRKWPWPAGLQPAR